MEEDVQALLRNGRHPPAFEKLLDLYETKVFRLVFLYLRDHARAEDVTQDIFLKVWRALPDYDGRASPSTWIYTIARNTCLSALRAESYRKTVPIDALNEPAVEPPREDAEGLAGLIARLPEVQREVLTLYYWQDRSTKEVALMLDLPEGTVKSHLHRARGALAAMMKE
jgi:RNA polymerase sigma-70 factor (ECF subfamily)